VKPYALISAPDHANLTAVWANMLAGSPSRVVATNHNQISMIIKNTRKLQEKMYPHLLRWFESWIYGLVSVSGGAADDLSQLTRLPRNKIYVVYNPIFSSEISVLAREPVSHPWFAPGQPPVILAAGRFEPQKDYLTLLDAFALLLKKRPVHMIILGEGSTFAEVRSRASALNLIANLDLPGFVANPYSYMSRAAVFVLSSRWEGFGNVLVEALACGTQVVSTDCPSGPAEILENGKFGSLVPVGDPIRMADAIEAALDSPIRTDLLIGQAQMFSIQSASNRYLELLGLS
jgi:glycosyltransferase involved in cell wall biosynthesis